MLDDVPLDAETKALEHPGDHRSELRLWLRMLTCTTLIETEVRRRLRAEFDVTLPRFDLMAQLEKSTDGITLGELSKRMMVTNGNVTALVDRLVADGLVVRRPAPRDGRATLVELTQAGRASFAAMARAHGAWIADLFGDLSPIDTATLMTLLGRTKAAVRSSTGRDDA